ncbi:reverse transcriptase domain-containing protein, partial [Tanacetum coccineum]
ITTLPVRPAPPSPDYVLASPDYSPDSDLDFDSSEDDSPDEDMIKTAESLLTQTTLTLVVHPPPSLLSSSSSPPLSLFPSSSSLPPSLLPSPSSSPPSSRKRSRSPSPPPSPSYLTTTTRDVETLHARAEAAEQRAEALQALLGAARIDIRDLIKSRRTDRLEMAELQSRAQDIEASLWDIERHLDPCPSDKKGYAGNIPLCNKCKFYHTGWCTAKCRNCKRIGHQTRDCRASASATTHKPLVAKQKTKATCYECGILGHYKSNCPKWKIQNHVNKHGKGKARGDSSVMAFNVNT